MSGGTENAEWSNTPLIALLKKYQSVLLVLVIGVVLLLIPSNHADGASEKEWNASASMNSESVGFDLEQQEKRMANILSQIEGVGKAEVLLTLSAGEQRIFALEEERSDSGSKTSPIVTRGSSGEESAVTTQVTAPAYQGALIVCEGGANPTVKLAVLKAVQALTGLSVSHISVCVASGGNEKVWASGNGMR